MRRSHLCPVTEGLHLDGHSSANRLKFAGMLALRCIHGFIVRLQKTECHCVQTDASRLLLSVFSSPLSADIFSKMQFYSLFPPCKLKTKNFWKNEKGAGGETFGEPLAFNPVELFLKKSKLISPLA